MSCQRWPGARSKPLVSTCGEKTIANPSTTTSSCTARSRSASTSAVRWIREWRASLTAVTAAMTATAMTTSHGLSLNDGAASAAAR